MSGGKQTPHEERPGSDRPHEHRSGVVPTSDNDLDGVSKEPKEPYDRRYALNIARTMQEYVARFPAVRGERRQTAAGLALGIGQSTVSRVASGREFPSLAIAIALAKATGKTLDEVVGYEREGVPPTAEDRMRRLEEKLAESIENARQVREMLEVSLQPPDNNGAGRRVRGVPTIPRKPR